MRASSPTCRAVGIAAAATRSASSRAISRTRVTDPEAFLAIKRANSLEEIQDLLMALPPESVLDGLDGEPVPRYEAEGSRCTEAQAKRRVQDLFNQAGAVATEMILSPPRDGDRGQIQISLLQADQQRAVSIPAVAPGARNGLAYNLCRAPEAHAPGESEGSAAIHASGRISDQGF